ncbi:MAG: hypothetical protein JNK89_00460, partial [Saprospiraceae bacterium]|nr:hypothetical protein [Saprospiraceae bacterium]
MKNICLILLLLSETARLNAQCSPDQIPPLLVPKINAAAPLGGPHCTAAVLPEQLLSSFSDNCTANPGISLRVRRAGAGAGLPLLPAGGQLLLTPDDFGAPVFAEVWARDAAGNTAFLYTRLTVQNPGGCAFALLPDTISAGAGLPQGIGLEDVSWLVSASLPPGAPVSTWELDQNLVLGADLFDGPAQDKIFEIQPSKDDNPLNGVTTYDAVLMLLDILQVQALGNPYKYLAADVNRDRRVNVADVVDLRKLVLGIYTELPDSPSWRFVPADYVFPFPNQPFYEIVPESIVFDRHRSAPLPDFIPLKVGDLNYNALLNSLQETDDRQTAELWLPDLPIQAGERVRVPVSLT